MGPESGVGVPGLSSASESASGITPGTPAALVIARVLAGWVDVAEHRVVQGLRPLPMRDLEDISLPSICERSLPHDNALRLVLRRIAPSPRAIPRGRGGPPLRMYGWLCGMSAEPLRVVLDCSAHVGNRSNKAPTASPQALTNEIRAVVRTPTEVLGVVNVIVFPLPLVCIRCGGVPLAGRATGCVVFSGGPSSAVLPRSLPPSAFAGSPVVHCRLARAWERAEQ